MRKEGFEEASCGDPEDPHRFFAVGANLFGAPGEHNYYASNDFFVNIYSTGSSGRLRISFSVGPIYHVRALKLDKAIPRMIKATKQIILKVQKEADGINNE